MTGLFLLCLPHRTNQQMNQRTHTHASKWRSVCDNIFTWIWQPPTKISFKIEALLVEKKCSFHFIEVLFCISHFEIASWHVRHSFAFVWLYECKYTVFVPNGTHYTQNHPFKWREENLWKCLIFEHIIEFVLRFMDFGLVCLYVVQIIYTCTLSF